MLEPCEIRRRMASGGFYPDIRVFDELDSTNSYLIREAASGIAEGTVAIARTQTAGKGRRGRGFASPAGGGLYLSVLLRPSAPPQDAALLTGCAAVAVLRAVEDTCGIAPDIKWVNDLLMKGRKICGILAESVLTGGSACVALGIGINISTPPEAFPPEARERAGSLLHTAGRSVAPEALAAAVLDRVAGVYSGFPGSAAQAVGEYRKHLATLGRDVTITGDPDGTVYRAEDIDERFGLIVSDAQGRRSILRSGEVSVRPC